jgi:putative oxygen-independent coproporphyrinogen III oxidase
MAGIYIHIPFCKKLCYYCDFYHTTISDHYQEFIDSILKEASLRKDYLRGESVSTIYFGGGTPSVFSIAELGSIINNINRLFSVKENSEITIELNPDDLSIEFLKELRKLGFNRISMGIQSWNDKRLKMLNRRHDSARAARALGETFEAGFDNVSIDLIYGIPGMTNEDLASDLDFSFSFGIKHLSAYHLTIEPGTVFGKMVEKGKISEISEEESTSQFNLLLEKSRNAGFVQYEISNFGRPGYFSIHNSNYWKQVPYIGLGPSAHSFDGFSRQWNVSNLNKYIKLMNSDSRFFEREDLDIKTRFNEYVMTSLRTMWGIDLDYVETAFEKEGYDYIINLAGKFKEYGMIYQEKNTLVLTDQGKMISDNIISEFMMPGND